MEKSSVKDHLVKAAALLASVFAPKTLRGRVRRAVFLILLLFVFAANMSYPRFWNDSADWLQDRTGVDTPRFSDIPFRLGLDLQGGTHLVYVADVSDIPAREHVEATSGVRDVIERRVNAFGVSEPLVQTNKSGDEWRVIVDLAGISDISEAIRLIGETPTLEFKEAGDGEPVRELTDEEREDMEAYNGEADAKADEVLRKTTAPDADFAALAREYSDDEATIDSGGDLGFIGSTHEYAPFAQMFDDGKYEPGEVAEKIVDSQYGHHIFKYEESREGEPEVKASHILICYTGAERCEAARTEGEALALADELREKATADNFAELAEENSDDLGSGANGGDLGWFGPGQMVAPFESAAFALETGAFSDIVETEFGYHIIYKEDERATQEHRISHIFIKTKSEADYLPASDPWKNTKLSGTHLKRSTLQFHAQTNEPQVGLDFNDEGKDLFADITSRNIGKPVAIFLDGQPVSIPTVNEEIRDGKAVITGNFTMQEAKLLVRRLNAGALRVPIRLESQQSVGASLGQESLARSLKAGLLGFLVVVLFMLMYYRLPGLIAIIALSLYASVNLTLYKVIPVTLTLSGIAGFILSVGMAVDANILIFERLKEELLRGRTLGSAIDEGFRRAWLSIRDSNFTTLISCAILFYTSSSLIKGFALTLGIGVLVSMFSAITVSRTLLRLFAGWRPFRKEVLYLPGFHKISETGGGQGVEEDV